MRHNVGDEIDTFCLDQRPTNTNEHEQGVSIWILPDARPFLQVSLQLGPRALQLWNGDALAHQGSRRSGHRGPYVTYNLYLESGMQYGAQFPEAL